MSDKAIMCSGKAAVNLYRLTALKQAVRLESIGMKASRGVNATKIARQELGLKARAPHAEVIAALEAKIKECVENGDAEGITVK